MADTDCTAIPDASIIRPSCLINKRPVVLDIDPLEMEVFYIAD